jgi:hypothetical protein
MIMNIFDIAKVPLLARSPAKLESTPAPLVLRPGEVNRRSFQGRGELVLPDDPERADHCAGPKRV